MARRRKTADGPEAAALRHRALLEELSGLLALLAGRLRGQLEGSGADGAGAAAADGPAALLDALSRSAARLVPLERQVLGLDRAAAEAEEQPLDDAERARRIARLLESVGARRPGRTAAQPAGTVATAAGAADDGL